LISEVFEDKGIVLSLSQLTNFNVPSPANLGNEINSMIDKAFKARKLEQFFENPVLSNIQDNPEIAIDVINAINDKNHPIRGALSKYNPDVTPQQLISYIKSISKVEDKRNWIVFPAVGVAVVLIAIFIIYFVS